MSKVLYEFANQSAVAALAPDFAALVSASDNAVIATAVGDDVDFVSRFFGPQVGIDEDPVTGGAHAVLTPFWTTKLGRESFSAYQASKRGGSLTCRIDGARVWLGGPCVTVVKGEFYL